MNYIASRTYYDVCASLSGSPADSEKLNSVISAHDMAMAYVWGWQDNCPQDQQGLDAYPFANIYALHVSDFELGYSHFRYPIVKAFEMYRSGDAIRNYS